MSTYLEVLDGGLDAVGGEEGGRVAVLVLVDVAVLHEVVEGARLRILHRLRGPVAPKSLLILQGTHNLLFVMDVA